MANVNIASLNVARPIKSITKHGEDKMLALCFMALDDDIPTNAMQTLDSLGFLHHVAKIDVR
jgi:hypothetical protein